MKEIKEFQTESKELLNLVINSIYSTKDIFLRELISNGSDAIDKYKFLAYKNKDLESRDYEIFLSIDKEARILKIHDNGIGMTKDELVNNLGTIARSGSKEFAKLLEDSKKTKKADLNIIGQFGVGFYSAFMVAKSIEVLTRKYDSDVGFRFESDGQETYSIEEEPDLEPGTTIVLHLKDNTDDCDYSDYLDQNWIQLLVKKYSDYVRYPIKMEMDRTKDKLDENGKPIEGEEIRYTEVVTLNSMLPLWKKNKKDLTDDELNSFYKSHYHDFEDPLLSLPLKVDGLICYNALLFIPAHAPRDLYSEEYEKGLDLYAKGVFIKEKCKDLLPDYLMFVKGLVDSDDLSLNVSREILQDDAALRKIQENIEKKLISTLKDLKDKDYEKYQKFFEVYGSFLKFGIYSSYGMKKNDLADLLIYYSLNDDKYISLKEYKEKMSSEQKYIYYAPGKTLESIKRFPQLERYKINKIDVLLLSDKVDEFTLLAMRDYDKIEFKNIGEDDKEELSGEEKAKIEKLQDDNKDLINRLKTSLQDKVIDVGFSTKLVDAPVCLSSKDKLSMNMEDVLQNEGNGSVKSSKILEINPDGALFKFLKENEEAIDIEKFGKVLYDEALLLQGLEIENKADFVSNINSLLITKK